MAFTSKRFTISVTPGMETELAEVKREYYCNSTFNEMLKDLIIRGLKSSKTEGENTRKGLKQGG